VDSKIQDLGDKEGKTVLVYFFGSHDYAWVKRNSIEPFEQSFSGNSINKKRKKLFDFAIKEALKWRDDPKKIMLSYAEKTGNGLAALAYDINVKDFESKEKKAKKREKKARNSEETGAGSGLIEDDGFIPLPVPAPDTTPQYIARKEHRQSIARKLGLIAPVDIYNEKIGKDGATKKTTNEKTDDIYKKGYSNHQSSTRRPRKQDPTGEDVDIDADPGTDADTDIDIDIDPPPKVT